MTSIPVIPGFHPDPSICRVGEDYYLATSTFEYFPGVPIFTSRDLVTWTQIGSILDRPSQLAVVPGIAGASRGIYAPTLRHHDGRFWMVTTNVHDIARGQLLVHAEEPAGPWSEPVLVPGLIGIDPDLAWDDEGVCRLTWSDVVRGGISQAEIDPLSGALLSEPREIWRGTGGAHAEGPHLLRRGGWWYLLIAEGGTAHGHMVTVARSRRPDGPFEANPLNPVLTHRSTALAVQSTGHADIVERPDGSWAMVFLGTRPRGSFPRWHTNGRETFLAGIEWVDDWPVVVEDRFDPRRTPASFEDRFQDPQLHPRWISPGVDPRTFADTGSGLRLDRGRAPESRAAERMLAARAVDHVWSTRLRAEGDIALSVRIDDAHQAILQRVGDTLTARVVIGPLDQVLANASVDADTELELRAEEVAVERGAAHGPDSLVLGLRSGEEFQELARIDGRYVSTEVAGGFTGRVIGVEALGDGVVVHRFLYEGFAVDGPATTTAMKENS